MRNNCVSASPAVDTIMPAMDGAVGRITILGSGSSGNATVLELGAHAKKCLLIDAGLSPSQVKRRMAVACTPGIVLGAILLTHLDTDHWQRSWSAQLEKRPIPVIVRRQHRARALEAGVPAHCLKVVEHSFSLGALAQCTAVEVPHDEDGSTAFLVESSAGRVGYATDLGEVPPRMLDTFRDLDVLALEANYDPALQRASPRPEFLKRRIMGSSGHLSNDQSAEAIDAIARRSSLQQLFLLHLSKDCNTPHLARSTVVSRCPSLHDCTVVAARHEPTASAVFSRAACPLTVREPTTVLC